MTSLTISGQRVNSFGRVSIHTNGTLGVRSVQLEDAGVYECRMVSADGRQRLATATLTVSYAGIHH